MNLVSRKDPVPLMAASVGLAMNPPHITEERAVFTQLKPVRMSGADGAEDASVFEDVKPAVRVRCRAGEAGTGAAPGSGSVSLECVTDAASAPKQKRKVLLFCLFVCLMRACVRVRLRVCGRALSSTALPGQNSHLEADSGILRAESSPPTLVNYAAVT